MFHSDGLPISIATWLDAHPTMMDAADWQNPVRLERMPHCDVPGAMRFFQYEFVTAAREEGGYRTVEGQLNFACDKGSVLLVQCCMEYKGKSAACDLTRCGDDAAVRMWRILIRNMVGFGRVLDCPVAPPTAYNPYEEPRVDISSL